MGLQVFKFTFFLGVLCFVARFGSAQAEEKLVEDAKAEGSLVLLSNMLDYSDVLEKAFSERYPFLKIEHRVFPSVGHDFHKELLSPVGEERVDVLLSCQHPFLLRFAKEGAFENLESLPNWPQRPEHFGDENYLIYFLASHHVLIYNPTLVKEEDLPKNYDELLNPKWRGKVAIRNPLLGNAGAFFSSYIFHTKGSLDWFDGMGKNEATVLRGQEVPLAVSQGQFPLGLSRDIDTISAIERHKLENIKIKFFKEYLPFQYQFALMIKRAPHPNAAKLFLNWVMKEGQDVLEKNGFTAGAARERLLGQKNTWRITTQGESVNLDALVNQSLALLKGKKAAARGAKP